MLLFFSCSVLSNSLRPHGLHYAMLPCHSPSPGACSNSCTLSRWCSRTISSSGIPCSPCLQSFSAARSFLISWLFASGGQSVDAFASASVLPVNIQSWSPCSLQGTLMSLSQHHSSKASILQCSAFFMVQLSHPYITTGKTIALTRQIGKVMSLGFLICCLGLS